MVGERQEKTAKEMDPYLPISREGSLIGWPVKIRITSVDEPHTDCLEKRAKRKSLFFR